MPQILIISPGNRLSSLEAWVKESFPGFEVQTVSELPEDISEASLIISETPLKTSGLYPPWVMVNGHGIDPEEARILGASLVLSPEGPWDKNQLERLLEAPSIRGDLSSFSLPDVLQLLAVKGGRHVVLVFSEEGHGRIFLEGEDVYFVEFHGRKTLSGLEALKRILGLGSGQFEVRFPLIWPKEANISGPIQALIIEATRLEDETDDTDFFLDLDELTPASSPQESGELARLRDIFPEASLIVVLDESGTVRESFGEGDREALSGLTSYISLNLTEIGESLALGDLKGFAMGGAKTLWAAVKRGNRTIALKAFPRKGILRWSKKLLEV